MYDRDRTHASMLGQGWLYWASHLRKSYSASTIHKTATDPMHLTFSMLTTLRLTCTAYWQCHTPPRGLTKRMGEAHWCFLFINSGEHKPLVIIWSWPCYLWITHITHLLHLPSSPLYHHRISCRPAPPSMVVNTTPLRGSGVEEVEEKCMCLHVSALLCFRNQ